MSDTVLITGISGFLGSHVALQTLQAGYKVRGSLRSLSRADEVRSTLKKHGANTDNLEFVALDLLSDKGWDEAMDGVRYLQHVASPFITEMPKDKMDLIRPAVEGTSRAITSALNSKVEHMVVTSSMAAIVYGHERTRTASFTEADWTDVTSPNANAYIQSKTLAEQKAWELVKTASREDDLSVINPSFILGPILNNDPGTSGKVIMTLLSGALPAAPRLELPCIDVRDVALAHVKAMTSPEAKGSRFVMAAGNLSMLEISAALKTQLPAYAKKLPRFELPNWIVRIIAIFDAQTRGIVTELGTTRILDSTKALALTGQDFISAKEATAAMGQSLVDQGLL